MRDSGRLLEETTVAAIDFVVFVRGLRDCIDGLVGRMHVWFSIGGGGGDGKNGRRMDVAFRVLFVSCLRVCGFYSGGVISAPSLCSSILYTYERAKGPARARFRRNPCDALQHPRHKARSTRYRVLYRRRFGHVPAVRVGLEVSKV